MLLDLLNKQNTETRRTNQFLRFALGVRSPEKKNYFKSKYFITPEESRLKGIENQNSNEPAGHKTAYNGNARRELGDEHSLNRIKKQTEEGRAKTSKGQDLRSVSMDMNQRQQDNSYQAYNNKGEQSNKKGVSGGNLSSAAISAGETTATKFPMIAK